DGSHIKLQIGAPAPPAISTVDYSTIAFGYITISGINGSPGAGVSVLMSTNLTLPLASWTVVGTGSFDGSGNLSPVSVPVDNTQTQQFYILSQYNCCLIGNWRNCCQFLWFYCGGIVLMPPRFLFCGCLTEVTTPCWQDAARQMGG